MLFSLYGIISFLLLIRFGNNCFKLLAKSKSNPTIKYKNANLVLIDEKTLPHTFLNSIFINFEDYNNRTIEEELYTHELVHVTQKHSLDILFIEFLKVIFWFNPLLIFYKKAIQLNHEFLADEEIVKTYNNVPFYQNLLLQKGFGTQTIYLASNLNYLVTKKRLIMMTKSTSQKIAILKKIAIAPILAGLIYFFCIEIVAQEKISNVNSVVKNSDITDKDKIRDNYYSGVYVKINDEKTNRKSVTLYEDLSLEDRRKYLDYNPEIFIEKEIPEALFKNLKTKNWKIGINNKLSSKEEIRKYKRTDFSYYSYSLVTKSERTKQFPKEYQYTLYTKEYFDKNMKDSNIHFSGDTIKIGYISYKSAFKNIIVKNSKADTIVWYTKDKEGYNLYINDSIKKKTITNTIYTINEIEVKPEFRGGISEFYKYFSKNFKIPEQAKKQKVKGIIFVDFIIEKDGTLTNVNIIKDLGFGTGEEAKRVLENTPKWNPGKIEDEIVRVKYVLPIKLETE